ncbi:MAG: hypothetical protein J5950_05485 [Clostridia bacterium]|nr:hypothetical protein [Clostridia bacterium]
MNKRLLAIIVACILTLSLFAACAKKPADVTDPTKAPATEAAATDAAPTAAPTEVVTQAPTEKPTEAPTKEPKPTMEVGDLDAIILDLEEAPYTTQACVAEMDDIWLTVTTDIGDNWIIFNFDEPFDGTEYPYIAFKYRMGYGQSIRNTNHFYSINEGSGGPAPTDGMWSDITWISDLDWHTGILDLASQFPAAEGKWKSIRFPTVDTKEGDFAIAWIGAFKSEEDIAKYDAAFNATYGDKLVKAEEPAEEDKEEIIPDLEDEFDEMVLDFEDFEDGDMMAPGMFDSYGYRVGANGSKMVDVDGNIVASISFDALYYDGIIKSGQGYIATFRFRNSGAATNFGGFVFNWGDERNTNRDLFENNGLEGDGKGSLTGNSGCGVFFQGKNKVKVYIPIWDIENNKRSYISTIIESDIDFDAAFVNVKVEDNGTDSVTVTVNDTVLFVVKYSDPGVINKALGYNEGYYRSVQITDASGTELASSASALFSIYKSFAWAGRAHAVIVDNIQIKNIK